MSEIKKRLQESGENCFKYYDAWTKDPKNPSAREALQDAVHELRKVASRLEIEIAVSERDEMASKPIPIPPHRASRKKGGDKKPPQEAGQDHDDAQPGNDDGKPAQRRGPRKKSAIAGE